MLFRSFVYTCKKDEQGFVLDTREVKVILEGLPVNSSEVLTFIRQYIEENEKEIE